VGAQAATKLLVEAGPENIFPHIVSLGDLLIEELEKLGMRYQGSHERKHRSGIYTFQGERIEELFEHLKSKKVHTALRMDAIRISPHFYNQPDEVHHIVEICTRFYRK
jgi:selenocysteine lyase/cysteine desulfurase